MKRSSRLNRRSRLRSRTELRRFTALHTARRRPQWRQVREQVRLRADGWCEVRIQGVCTGLGSHAHHRLMRSQGGQDVPENLLWACPSCHDAIHHDPEASYAAGWLLRRSA